MSAYKFILVATVIAFLAICIYTGLTTKKGSPGPMLAYLLREKKLSHELENTLRPILAFYTENTPYQQQWQINQPPKKGYINVYLVNTDSLSGDMAFTGRFPAWKKYQHNCKSTGYFNAVICDVHLLKYFLIEKGVQQVLEKYNNKAVAEIMIQENVSAFLYWIIGHELGHVTGRHQAANSNEPSLSAIVSNARLDQQEEWLADSFAVGRLGLNDTLALRFTRMAIDVLNKEIQDKTGPNLPAGVGILFDYTNERMVEYSLDGQHPEFVLRLIRALGMIASIRHDTGLENEVTAFQQNLRQAAR